MSRLSTKQRRARRRRRARYLPSITWGMLLKVLRTPDEPLYWAVISERVARILDRHHVPVPPRTLVVPDVRAPG